MHNEQLQKRAREVLESLLIAFLIFGVLWLYGFEKLQTYSLFGLSYADSANLLENASYLVPLLTGVLFLVRAAFDLLWRAGKRRFWPEAGTDPISDAQLDQVIDALLGQKDQIRGRTSWPEHYATARTARSATQAHFGDARFSTPARDIKRIRRFLGAPRNRFNAATFESSVMLITGEPGAGKSVLTQEIHASLVDGIRKKNHSYTPLVVFASSLTLDLLGSTPSNAPRLRDLLVLYFRTIDRGRYDQLARFIETSWSDHDFLIIVDGLDEIAQRSAYEAVQRQLKAVIQSELSSERRRVRRYIMSCRIADDIDVFADARSVVLRGLRSESERIRFCDNIVRNAHLPKQGREVLLRILERNSKSLASVDVFRRNPYFLSLLVTYFQTPAEDEADRKIDFDHLIQSYIARETRRLPADARWSPETSRARIAQRRTLQACAGIFLQAMAFNMTASRREDALYGECTISQSFLDFFVATIEASRELGEDGPWHTVGQLVARLANGVPLSDAELNQFLQGSWLGEEDLRVLSGLASDTQRAPRESVIGAFSVIAFQGQVADQEWYHRLASTIAEAGAAHFEHAASRVALLLMARGLVAAQVLLLVYVEPGVDGLAARFRHRRLAEYYAASFFRDRWLELDWLDDSPWLTPILNLVAAIEGERSKALAWFVDRVPLEPGGDAFAWRSRVAAAAEGAAFATGGPDFPALLTRLAELLTGSLKIIRQRSTRLEPRDVVSEFTTIQALDFLGSLDVDPIRLAPAERRAFFRDQGERPAAVSLYAAKAANAVARLTNSPPPLRFKLKLLANVLAYPNSILMDRAEAFRAGAGAQWFICVAYVILTEFMLVWLAWSAGAGVLRFALGGQPPAAVATPRLLALGTLSAIWLMFRALQWWRSPNTAARWNAVPAILATKMMEAVLFIGELLLSRATALPEDSKSAARALREMLPTMGKAVIGLVVVWCAILFVILLVGVAATYAPTQPAAPPEPVASALPEPDKCTAITDARHKLEAIRPPAGSDWSHLLQVRRQLTYSAHRLDSLSRESGCTVDDTFYQNQSAAAAALDRLAATVPTLIPLAKGPPRFDADDFARLRRLTSKTYPLPPTDLVRGAVEAFRQLWQVVGHQQLLAREIVRLRSARSAGRATDQHNGQYPERAQFVAFATATEKLLERAGLAMRALEERQKVLQSQAIRACALWFFAAVMAILAYRLLNVWRAFRRDRRKLAELRSKSVETLCKVLVDPRSSDWLRQQIRLVLADRDVQREDLEHIDRAANMLGNRRHSPRDIQFGTRLGDTMAGLSRRAWR